MSNESQSQPATNRRRGRDEVKAPAEGALRIGRVLKPHGLKGALKLELHTDAPEKRFASGASVLTVAGPTSTWIGSELTVRELRWYNDQPVVFFEEIPDRTAAEALVPVELWVVPDADDASDEDDAWYDHELVGLNVRRDGVVIGIVQRVDHLPAQDLLVVGTPTGDVLVPFVSAIVPEVNPAEGYLVVTPPAGLFEPVPGAEPDRPEPGIPADLDD